MPETEPDSTPPYLAAISIRITPIMFPKEIPAGLRGENPQISMLRDIKTQANSSLVSPGEDLSAAAKPRQTK